MQFMLDAAPARDQRSGGAARAWTTCRASTSSTRRSQTEAYADRALPIACGQTISQPYLVAYMTEQLGVQPEHRVLEVGTGSGYQAAVLSRLAREVVSVERYRTLGRCRAQPPCDARLSATSTCAYADGLAGVPERAPYDRIIVTAAAETVPEALVEQLAKDGVMILPLGPQDGVQQLVQITKGEGGTQAGGFDRRALCAAFAGTSARIVRNLPIIG